LIARDPTRLRWIMRQIVLFAGMLIAMALVAARFADQTARQPAVAAPAATVATAQPAAAPITSGTSVTIQRDGRGHFATSARVDGRRMEFMIDTGASLIALRASDAALLGIHPPAREFTAVVKTANGTVRAAPIELGMVEISGVTVRDVAALVLPDEALGENLLGMSFLSRLRRFEYGNGRLVLEQ
jgi:aspartyl protease family protein